MGGLILAILVVRVLFGMLLEMLRVFHVYFWWRADQRSLRRFGISSFFQYYDAVEGYRRGAR